MADGLCRESRASLIQAEAAPFRVMAVYPVNQEGLRPRRPPEPLRRSLLVQ